MTNKQLPRLTEIGDTFAAVVASCLPVEDKAHFTFVGYDGALTFSRINVDAKLMDMGFYDKPTRNSDPDGVILYADVAGETLRFTRVAGTRGGIGWRIEKVAPVAPPVAPPVAAKAPPAPEPPERVVTLPRDGTARVVQAGERIQVDATPEAKRENIRAAYERELAYVLAGPYKLAKKAKAGFDVAAATSTILIEMAKRGCL